MTSRTNDELRDYLSKKKIDVVAKYGHLVKEEPTRSVEELRAMFDEAGVSLADEIIKEREASRF